LINVIYFNVNNILDILIFIIKMSKPENRYCIECGSKMSKSSKLCPACGESQI